MRSQTPAIMLGLYGINSLGTVRSLGREGIPVIGLHIDNGRPTHATASRYLDRSIIVRNERELTETLLELSLPGKPPIFCTEDRFARYCGSARDELFKRYHIPSPRNHSLSTLMHKREILPIAQEAGFKVPQNADLLEKEALELRYPVIVKPTGILHDGKANISIFDTPAQLRDVRNKLLDQYGNMVVEEFIPGDITHHYEVHTYGGKENVVIGMMLRKLRSFQIGVVPTGTLLESVWEPSLVAPATEFTKEVDFPGPIDINLIRREGTEDYYFIEANFRTSANLDLDRVAGVNLPALIHFHLTGEVEKTKRLANRKVKEGVKWVDEGKDLYALLNKEVPLSDYLRSLTRTRAFGFYDPRDPLPLLRSVLNRDFLFKARKRGD